MFVLREHLKPASELKSVSCGIPDTQYSVCEEIETGRYSMWAKTVYNRVRNELSQKNI